MNMRGRRRIAQIAINGEILRNRLLDVGVKPSVASKEIRFSVSYIAGAIKNGNINFSAAKALQAAYGINPNDYSVDDDMPTKPGEFYKPSFVSEEPIDIEAAIKPEKGGTPIAPIPEMIRDAVREGVLDAFYQVACNEDLLQVLDKIIYNAAKGAIINADKLIKGDIDEPQTIRGGIRSADSKAEYRRDYGGFTAPVRRQA